MSRRPAKAALAATAFSLLLGLTATAQAVQDTTTDYQYDANGNLTQVISPLDTASNPVLTDFLYDALDQPSVTTQPAPVAGGQRPNIFYRHDGLGQVTQVEDPRLLATDYTVDGLGNVTALASPDSGITNSTYDADGNLKTATDARGKTTTYSYDALGRLTKADYPTGTDTVYTYDGGPGNTDPTNVGKLTQMADEAGTTTYRYDALGRLVAKTQALTGTQSAWTLAVGYGYGTAGTANGKLASLTYPSGNKVNYAYDAAGRVSAVTLNPVNASGIGQNPTATVLLNNIQYTPTGRFASATWGNSTVAVPSTLTRTDDLDGRTTGYTLGNASQKGLVRSLLYDAGSRVTAMTHTGGGTGAFAPANFNQAFSYDNLGRLTGYTVGASSLTYGYDASGNRTASGAGNYTVDTNSNRLLSTPTFAYTYDAVGNTLAGGTVTYTYSDRGRLATVKVGTATTAYGYNGLEQRVKKVGTADTTIVQYAYDEQGRLLGEYDFYGNPLQETVYLGGLPIAALTQTVTNTGPGSVTVDNTDTANVAVVGSWPASAGIAGFIGTNYQYHATTATTTDSFTWKLNLPAAGKYYLQVRWTQDPGRSTNAKYTATGPDGVTARAYNQRAGGGIWSTMGLKAVPAPGLVTVRLDTSSTGYVIADAVRALPASVATKVNYIFADHLGTPRVITRATDNQMVWRWDNADPFGAAPPNQDPNALGTFTYNPRFPGQVYDGETGLYYNYHRHYSPSTGTYRQSDPIGLAGGINTYAYVGGNPVNAIDPLGLEVASPELMNAYLNTPSLNRQEAELMLSIYGGMLGGEILGAAKGAYQLGKACSVAKETTTLYRAVTQGELKQIQRTGTFEAGPNSLGGKWFAETRDHARQWGDVMNGKGNSTVLDVQLPRTQADQLMRMDRLDGIGPARYGELDQLNGAIIKGSGL